MTRRYERTDPDPQRAERERAHVRNRVADEFPLWSDALNSVVDRGGDLDTAVRDLARLRARNARSRGRARAGR